MVHVAILLQEYIVNSCHCHKQRQSFLLQISKMYECIPRCAIDKFVELCLVCHTSKPQNTRAPLKPIISSGFMTRGQVGTIHACMLCAVAACPALIMISYSLSCVNDFISD